MQGIKFCSIPSAAVRQSSALVSVSRECSVFWRMLSWQKCHRHSLPLDPAIAPQPELIGGAAGLPQARLQWFVGTVQPDYRLFVRSAGLQCGGAALTGANYRASGSEKWQIARERLSANNSTAAAGQPAESNKDSSRLNKY
jgi:hypothetical protein